MAGWLSVLLIAVVLCEFMLQTLQPALQQVETGKVSIADAKSQVQSLNVSEYTGDIDSLNTKVRE